MVRCSRPAKMVRALLHSLWLGTGFSLDFSLCMCSAMSKQGHVTYSEVFKFLSNNSSKYADECSESRKRAIRRFSEKVVLEDGLLFYLQFCDKDKKEVKRKKAVDQ